MVEINKEIIATVNKTGRIGTLGTANKRNQKVNLIRVDVAEEESGRDEGQQGIYLEDEPVSLDQVDSGR